MIAPLGTPGPTKSQVKSEHIPVFLLCPEYHTMVERMTSDEDEAACDRCGAVAQGDQLWMVCAHCGGWCLCPDCMMAELKEQAGVVLNEKGGGECPLCDMDLNGPTQLEDHLVGRKHIKNARKCGPGEGPCPDVRIWDS